MAPWSYACDEHKDDGGKPSNVEGAFYRTHVAKKRSAKKRHENGDGEIKEFGCPELGRSDVMKVLLVGSDVQAQDTCSAGSQCQVQLPWH